jgi:CO/xanthine dehydrogenase Mo-binding subunit
MGKVYAGFYAENTSADWNAINWQLNLKVPATMNYIGKRRVLDKEAREKCSGYGVFTRDVFVPGMLYAKGITVGMDKAPWAHAKIKTMDTSKAAALPGVRSILRYDDADWQAVATTFSIYSKTNISMVGDEAMCPNQIIACVIAADTEEQCDEALRLVDITWDQLPFNVNWDIGMKANATVICPEIKGFEKTNVHRDVTLTWGNIEQGFKDADQTIEWEYHDTEDTDLHVEPQTTICQYVGDAMNFWHRHQRPFGGLSTLTSKMGLAWARMNYTNCYGGAMFGGMLHGYANSLPPIPAVLANRTGRPVRFLYDSECHFMFGGQENGTYKYKIGFKKDGTITAVDMTTVNVRNAGGCTEDTRKQTGIKNLREHDYGVLTNEGSKLCYRDGGDFQQVIQQITAHVADALKMSPIDIALKNQGHNYYDEVTKQEEQRYWSEAADYRKKKFLQPNRNSLQECVDIAKKAFDWDNKWHSPGTKILANGRYHGIGFHWTHCWTLSKRPAHFGCCVWRDGTVSLLAQECSSGPNRRVAYCQVVADEIGMKIEDVEYRGLHDYGVWWPNPCGGSTGLSSNMPSIVRVARKAKQAILELACQTVPVGSVKSIRAIPADGAPSFPGKKPEELDIKDSVIFEKAKPDNKVTVAAVASRHWGTMEASRAQEPIQVDDYTGNLDWQPASPFQVHMVEVEVDPDTGKVYWTKAVSCNDMGKIINPDGCNGQQWGGQIMGMSRSNQEEVIYDPQTGLKINDNFCFYPVAVMNDCPPVDCYLIETQQGYSAYGCCGIGENVGACQCSASMDAVYNAIGKWVDRLPTTPNSVLKALGKA